MSVEEEAAAQDCFGDRHARLSLLELQFGQSTGRRLLEITQAQAILVIYYQMHGELLTITSVLTIFSKVD
jgi:hypothetical protein